MREALDFILCVKAEAHEGCGEDSWCHAFTPTVGLLGAFDGCGGSGARKHKCYSDHTEAYMASRLCAGAFYDAFRDSFTGREGAQDVRQIIDRCARYCRGSFSAYRPAGESTSKIRSSMITTLPTTAAAALLRRDGKYLAVTAAWAGDSRVYALTPSGLAQLSVDDFDRYDPFETDGMMNNTITADRPPRINQSLSTIDLPAIILTATDGCFAYYTTPMEFEAMLLSTLLYSATPAQWEDALLEQIGEVAGDDYTMTLAAFGFRDFQALRQMFHARYRRIYDEYLSKIAELPLTDRASRRELWEHYRPEYTKFIKG